MERNCGRHGCSAWESRLVFASSSFVSYNNNHPPPPPVTKATPEGAISLGVAGKRVPTKPDADGAKKHTGRRTKKMLRGLKLMRPSPPPLTFVATELASRGWDVTNRQWREPLYPQLDQYFLPIVDPADESVSTVWRIQPPSLRHRGKCV